MHRHELSDSQYARLGPFLPELRHQGKAGRPGCPTAPSSTASCGSSAPAPLRDLPERYGKWNTVYTRFKRGVGDGTRTGIFSTLLDERDDQGQLDHDLWCIDGTIVHAARCAGAPTAQPSPPAPGRRIDDATRRAGRPCVGLLAGRLHDQDSRAVRQPGHDGGHPCHARPTSRKPGVRVDHAAGVPAESSGPSSLATSTGRRQGVQLPSDLALAESSTDRPRHPHPEGPTSARRLRQGGVPEAKHHRTRRGLVQREPTVIDEVRETRGKLCRLLDHRLPCSVVVNGKRRLFNRA